MKTLIVTAGRRWEFPVIAARSARWCNSLLETAGSGIRAVDLSPIIPWKKIRYSYFSKAYAWDVVPRDVDRIIWMDCDCILLRPIMDGDIPDCDFGAVPDEGADVTNYRLTVDALKDLPNFFNTGVVIAKRSTIPVFEEVKTHHKEMTGQWHDQGWFNLAVERHLGCWTRLDEEWNAIVGRARTANPFIMHLAGMWPRAYYITAMYQAIESVARTVQAAR